MKSDSTTQPRCDIATLKKRVGASPFIKRLPQLSADGFSPCPFHNGDGDKTFHLLERPDGSVTGTCFSSCDKTWDAIAFVQQFENVPFQQALETIESEDITSLDAVRLQAAQEHEPMTPEKWGTSGREVTNADVQQLAASRPHSATPSAKTLNEMGFKVGDVYGHVNLVAPYRLGNKFYTLKGRNLSQKFFMQENCISQKALFNIDAVRSDRDVFVVESELDAAVFHEHGYTAVSLLTSKQKEIEPEILKKLLPAKRIFLVGDMDEPGQKCMDAIAKLLPTEKTYRIKLSAGAKDIGEWALRAKRDEAILGGFSDQWDDLVNAVTASWVSQNIPYVATIEDRPVEWVVNRILPYGGLCLMSGKYGAQKSLWALFMAAGIEAGTSVFGRKVLRPIPVLYVDRENPKAVVGERRSRMGIPSDAVRYWGDWLEAAATPSLDDRRLAEFARREQGVIIFDSLQDWLDGSNENDTAAMAALMHQFKRLARLGAGVIVLHHFAKYSKSARGATAIAAATDMALLAEKNDEGVLEIREDRFRMCGKWELDIKFRFDGPFTYEVLRDEVPERRAKTPVLPKEPKSTKLDAAVKIGSDFIETRWSQGESVSVGEVTKALEAHTSPVFSRAVRRDALSNLAARFHAARKEDGLDKRYYYKPTRSDRQTVMISAEDSDEVF